MAIQPRQTLLLLMVSLLTVMSACTNAESQQLGEGSEPRSTQEPAQDSSQELPQKPTGLTQESSPSDDFAKDDSPTKSGNDYRNVDNFMLSGLNDRCQSAIATVADNISSTSDAYIGHVVTPDWYVPESGPEQLLLQLESDDTMVRYNVVQSSSALAILDAKSALIQYANTITQDCQSIGSVIFQISSSQAIEIGLVDGQLTEFTCELGAGNYGEETPGTRYCQEPITANLEPLPQQVGASCRAALAQVETLLEQDHNTYIHYRALWHGENSDGENNEGDRPGSLSLYLDAYNSFSIGDAVNYSAALRPMESPDMLIQYADIAMTDCNRVGTVSFHLNEYQRRSFEMVGGRVTETSCDSPAPTTYCDYD